MSTDATWHDETEALWELQECITLLACGARAPVRHLDSCRPIDVFIAMVVDGAAPIGQMHHTHTYHTDDGQYVGTYMTVYGNYVVAAIRRTADGSYEWLHRPEYTDYGINAYRRYSAIESELVGDVYPYDSAVGTDA